jgi:hypothetical protein
MGQLMLLLPRCWWLVTALAADGERLRLMLERSRLAAVAEAAAARARTSSLDKQVRDMREAARARVPWRTADKTCNASVGAVL